MTNKIEVDVTSAVRDFYPALSNSEIDLLAKKVFENWDYSEIYNTLLEDIYTYAQFNSIDLDGKDGVEAA
tara:strand:+ start:124 stop:333 length:210 start_codon:yes stop_codon:yes gene_type:complete